MDKNQDKNTNIQMLDEGDTAKVTGGFIGPNKYSDDEYKAAGIKVCPHVLKKDEFLIIKTNRKISKSDANKIVELKRLKDDTVQLEKSIKSHVRGQMNNGSFETDFSSYDA